ncbi:cytochrome P450, family 82, subfamily C, polypeptide 4 [Hibiscus trionum]|uniref:Cytochrome P450, family 82, subfamily C, polypeptide 4 n=1 Tax=Hibiscus trionum TaxID=183268 RepID=A0A9W7HI49_HIBTR|nr:cytochrome P450, family 82, subfamily C, polypeptide 4 [Hibiscus trionum]
MDSFHSVTTTSTIAIICVPLLLFLFSFLWISKAISRSKNQRKTAPEAGGAWPVIGHLRLLAGRQPPHISLANMADKYGTIFTIKLGSIRHSSKAPKHGNLGIQQRVNAMIAFAPYGPYWRQVRKFITIELLSNHRLDSLKHVRESEIKTSLQQLYELWNRKRSSGIDKVLVEMKTWFKDVTLNVILRIIIGKRISDSYERDDETLKWKKSLDNFMEMSGKFNVSDALPFLRWFDIGGDEKFMRKIVEELDRVVEVWLREHKQKRVQDEANSEKDFMGVMLSHLRDVEEHEADIINKATSLDLILAGEDTTAITLTWALSLLLNNRDALNKIQQELNTHVGQDKLFAAESDTKNLVYLQSVIKETLRLYPAAPLSLVHEAIQECTINGYHVSAGTWLILNLQKIQRDPRVWENPFEFRPERFMTTHKDVDVRGQNFELIPFSSGRRMCPGISFALQILQLTLANLLHWFEFETPSGEAIDMREAAGLTSSKATPLNVHITPRLPAFVYDSTS